jgi:hypothetical protein
MGAAVLVASALTVTAAPAAAGYFLNDAPSFSPCYLKR